MMMQRLLEVRMMEVLEGIGSAGASVVSCCSRAGRPSATLCEGVGWVWDLVHQTGRFSQRRGRLGSLMPSHPRPDGFLRQ